MRTPSVEKACQLVPSPLRIRQSNRFSPPVKERPCRTGGVIVIIPRPSARITFKIGTRLPRKSDEAVLAPS